MDAGRFISASKARDAMENRRGFVYEITYLSEDEAVGTIKKKVIYKEEPKEPEDIIGIDILELEPGAELLPKLDRYNARYYRVGEHSFCCERGEAFSYNNTTDHVIKITVVTFAVIV